MREIKFRGWYKKELMSSYMRVDFPCMIYDVQDAYDCELGQSFSDILSDENAIVMQFTGLQDIKGKDIYEGDVIKSKVLKADNGKYLTVEVKWNQDYCGFEPFFPDGHEEYWCFSNCEVIGNIHKNPELVKKNE